MRRRYNKITASPIIKLSRSIVEHCPENYKNYFRSGRNFSPSSGSSWNSVMVLQYRLGIWVMRHRGFSRPWMATVS